MKTEALRFFASVFGILVLLSAGFFFGYEFSALKFEARIEARGLSKPTCDLQSDLVQRAEIQLAVCERIHEIYGRHISALIAAGETCRKAMGMGAEVDP